MVFCAESRLVSQWPNQMERIEASSEADNFNQCFALRTLIIERQREYAAFSK